MAKKMATSGGVVAQVAGLPRGAGADGLLAALVTVAAALLARPFSGTTLGDDFSYAKTALDFANTGHLIYNGWASMMLGWQAVWGALFIRVFGFSFNVLRLSMLLLAGMCVLLFHRILLRSGVRRVDAIAGALMLSLTPLFFPLAASFMSDIPGLLSVLVCAWMCQRAVAAGTDRATVAWLLAAGVVNLMTGTVRQICWMGVLVMVPSTAWYLRRRRGVVVTVAALWVLSLGIILLSIHWLNSQPWALPEHLLPGRVNLFRLGHLTLQMMKAGLVTMLLVAPASVALLWARRGQVVALAGCFFVPAAVMALLLATGHGRAWLMPWLVPVLQSQGMSEPQGPVLNPVTLHQGTRAVISILTTGLGLFALVQAWQLLRRERFRISGRSREIAWIWGPFVVAVLLLMASRGMFSILQDRYLLLLLPAALVCLLLLYERLTANPLPLFCWALMLVYAAYAVAGLHDQQAGARADVAAVAELAAAGVPRTAVAEGFGPDEWVEVSRSGHVNNVNFVHSKLGTYQQVKPWNLAPECMPFNWDYTPSFSPRYYLMSTPGRCYRASGFAPVPYRAWLPPFHRATYIELSAYQGTP